MELQYGCVFIGVGLITWVVWTRHTRHTKPLRIAFGCQKRVGKDTACEHLQQKYGGKVMNFAGPLYDILEFACDRANIPYRKDRKFLQWVGTEWGRSIDENIWIDAMMNDIEHSKESNIFVSDVRFPNEMEALRKAGFTLVRLVRNIDINDDHVSENILLDTPPEKWDYIMDNNGSLEDLYGKLEMIV